MTGAQAHVAAIQASTAVRQTVGAMEPMWMRNVGRELQKQFGTRHPDCTLLVQAPETVSDLLELLDGLLKSATKLWFRGQENFLHSLTPSGLRFGKPTDCNRAIGLLGDFKRIVRTRLPTGSMPSNELEWVQVAQHYGLPTRLLDWTTNPIVALWFACRQAESNGGVFMVNPGDLNLASIVKQQTLCSYEAHRTMIDSILTGKTRSTRRDTVAVVPVWNSERLIRQDGVFTVHGSREPSLSRSSTSKMRVPSLLCIPVLQEEKRSLLEQLGQIGVHEMSLFPEIEHVCAHLKSDVGLRA